MFYVDVIDSGCPLRRANIVARAQTTMSRRRMSPEEGEVRMFPNVDNWRRIMEADHGTESHLVFLHVSEIGWQECVFRCEEIAKDLSSGHFCLVSYTGGPRTPVNEPVADNLTPKNVSWWKHLFEVKALRDFNPGDEDVAVEQVGRAQPPVEHFIDSVRSGQPFAVQAADAPPEADNVPASVRHDLINAIEPLLIAARIALAENHPIFKFHKLWRHMGERLRGNTDFLPAWTLGFLKATEAKWQNKPEGPSVVNGELVGLIADLEKLLGHAISIGRPKANWAQFRELLKATRGDKEPRVLWIDDDDTFLDAFQPIFDSCGIRLTFADDPSRFIRDPEQVSEYDAVILDMKIAGYGRMIDEALRTADISDEGVTDEVAGRGLLRLFGLVPRCPPVFILSARESVSVIEACIQYGARGYLIKGHTDYIGFLATLAREICERQKDRMATQEPLNGKLCVGKSDPLRGIISDCDRFASRKGPVLLVGQPGVGKEQLARELHLRSLRYGRKDVFCVFDCAKAHEELIESELFGHVKGAFPTAPGKKGYIEEANTGTLFIDEIDKIEIAEQEKLLRFIQERTIEPVGSTKTIAIDVLLVLGSNRDPHSEANSHRFSEAFRSRLRKIVVHVPTLRDRIGALEEVARGILVRICREEKLLATNLSPEGIAWLRQQVAENKFDGAAGNLRGLADFLDSVTMYFPTTRVIEPVHMNSVWTRMQTVERQPEVTDVFSDIGRMLADYSKKQQGRLDDIEDAIRAAFIKALLASHGREAICEMLGTTRANFRALLTRLRRKRLLDAV